MHRYIVDALRIWLDALGYIAPWKRRVDRPSVSREALLCVAGMFVLLSVLTEIPFLEEGWQLNEYGLSTVFAQTGIAAAICCLSGFLNIPSRRILAYVLVFASLYLVTLTLLSSALIQLYGRYPTLPVWIFYASWAGLLIWLIVAAFRAGTNAGHIRARGGGLVAAAALFSMFGMIPNSPIFYTYNSTDTRGDIWYFARQLWPKPVTTDATAASNLPSPDWEKLLYDQPQKIQEAVKAIAASDEQPHVYFIGAAPYGSQTVFKREVDASRAIFDSHFKSSGRSVILANTRDEADPTPLASTSNLKQLAKGLSTKIDPMKDIVVLFVTSHGSRDLISVDQHPLPLNQIKPSDLKEILAATGAVNRMVIISACYSGSFIDDLKDDHTAILTAARDDRTSFGCSNERDWTYFTNALFNHGFRKTRDFKEAFRIASDLVGKWEKDRSLEPSLPQIFVGEAFAGAWQKLMPTFDQSVSEPLVTPETAELVR